MILPPVVRVFFAIGLSDSIKKQLNHYIDSLKKISKSRYVRWTRPENLHITLQFLAEVRGEDIDGMINAVTKALSASVPPLEITLRTLHWYPDPHRPRVLALDVVPQAELAKLSEIIGNAIKTTGYQIEERPFRAHMTIGRIKTDKIQALNFLSEVAPPDIGSINIDEVVLFKSEPQPDGSRYVPLYRLPLA